MAIATINPATGEVVKTFQPLSEAEIEKKLQLSVNAFKSERKTPFSTRAKRMLKAAEILERDKDKFAHLMTLEMGKPYKAAVAEAVKC
ncbi:MAG TPA: aldehyde dehydrogenase family protein, partial [Candidatus Sulfotelmatobacter sp.]